MARRRRKALGSTRSQHTAELDGSLQLARVAGERVAKTLKEGRCTLAGKQLLEAASLWGRYNVHRQASGSTAAGENAASNRYSDVKEQFLDRCVMIAPERRR